MMADGKNEPTVGELLSPLARDTRLLVRKEVQLASAEMTVKAQTFARCAGTIALGGAFALVGLMALVFALIFGLQAWLPLWLSALLVGLAVLGAGYGFVRKGLDAIRKIDLLPEQTIGTLSDDVAWVKEQVL